MIVPAEAKLGVTSSGPQSVAAVDATTATTTTSTNSVIVVTRRRRRAPFQRRHACSGGSRCAHRTIDGCDRSILLHRSLIRIARLTRTQDAHLGDRSSVLPDAVVYCLLFGGR